MTAFHPWLGLLLLFGVGFAANAGLQFTQFGLYAAILAVTTPVVLLAVRLLTPPMEADGSPSTSLQQNSKGDR